MEKNEVFNKEFSEILEKEEKLLDSLAQKQLVLRKAVVEKDWESLQTLISETRKSDGTKKYRRNQTIF